MKGYYPFMERHNYLYKYGKPKHSLRGLALACLEWHALIGMKQENYIDTIIPKISVLSWTLRILST